MTTEALFLYTRKGCCLCKALEDRLNNMSLENLTPSFRLVVIDIDSSEASEDDKRKYNLEVPVLAINCKQKRCKVPLPRVSLRLKDQALFVWLENNISKVY